MFCVHFAFKRFCAFVINVLFHRCMTSEVLWLASIADGARRSGGRGSEGHRRVWSLPATSGIVNLLDQHGEGTAAKMLLECAGSQRSVFDAYTSFRGRSSAARKGGVPVCAMLKVSAAQGCCHNAGVLTNWDEQSLYQRLFYNYPLDDYNLHVDDVKAVAELQVILLQASHYGDDSEVDVRSHFFTGCGTARQTRWM